MNVTIGSNCWDGVRRKSLIDTPAVVGAVPAAELSSTFKDRAVKVMRDPKVKAVIGFTIPLVLIASGLPHLPASFGLAQHAAVAVFAPDVVPAGAIGDAIKGKVLHAFDPLMDLITTLSYPIAGVMIAAGCLFIMVGNKERGMQMLQNAAIGYILVQLVPLFLKLLVGVGESV